MTSLNDVVAIKIHMQRVEQLCYLATGLSASRGTGSRSWRQAVRLADTTTSSYRPYGSRGQARHPVDPLSATLQLARSAARSSARTAVRHRPLQGRNPEGYLLKAYVAETIAARRTAFLSDPFKARMGVIGSRT